jgi:hypothetical protein
MHRLKKLTLLEVLSTGQEKKVTGQHEGTISKMVLLVFQGKN